MAAPFLLGLRYFFSIACLQRQHEPCGHSHQPAFMHEQTPGLKGWFFSISIHLRRPLLLCDQVWTPWQPYQRQYHSAANDYQIEKDHHIESSG
jgi:hypothetical protein